MAQEVTFDIIKSDTFLLVLWQTILSNDGHDNELQLQFIWELGGIAGYCWR